MFIVIDGIDGSGKSTVCKKLLERIQKPTTQIRTPGSGFKCIRDLVLNPDYNIPNNSKMFLFLAEMMFLEKEHDLRNPDKIIISDRFYISTYIYQFLLNIKEYSYSEISIINGIFKHFLPQIDLTFILTVSVEEGIRRSSEKGLEFGKKDAFESSNIKEWESRKSLYDNIAHCGSFSDKLGKVCVIDTTKINEDQVADIIYTRILLAM